MNETFVREIKTKTDIWYFLNDAKTDAIQRNWSEDKLIALWEACNELFYEATGNKICPGWWLGGFANTSKPY